MNKTIHLKELAFALLLFFIGSMQLSAQTLICDNNAGTACTEITGTAISNIEPILTSQSISVVSGTSGYFTFTATAGVTYEFSLSGFTGAQRNVALTVQSSLGPNFYRKQYNTEGNTGTETARYTAPTTAIYRVRYSLSNCSNVTSAGTFSYRIHKEVYGVNEWVGLIYSQYTNPTNFNPTDAFTPDKLKGKLVEAEIFDRNYEGLSPGCGATVTNFAIKYRMKKAYAPGMYKITIRGDDGFRFRKNGVTIFDAWIEGWRSEPHIFYACFDGSEQDLEIDYHQYGGPGYMGYQVELASSTNIGSARLEGNSQLCSAASTTTFTPSVIATGTNWVSSNPAVATVSSTGVVAAVSPGTANIQYRSGICVIASKLVMVNHDITGTINKVDPSNCTANGTITVNPDKSNFRAGRYWYRNNFNGSTNPQIGSSAVSGTGGNTPISDANNLRLTTLTNGSAQTGALTVSNPGFNENAVSVNFDMFIGGGRGGNGLTLSYGSLILNIDTYRNGTESCLPENTTGGKTAISITYGGTQIKCAGTFDIRNKWNNVNLFIDHSGRIIITLDGQEILNETLPSAYTTATKSAWQWVFSASVAATVRDEHRIDNVTIASYNNYEYKLNAGAWVTTNLFTGLSNIDIVAQLRNAGANLICSQQTLTINGDKMPAHSYTFNVANGNWDNPNNWTPNGVPTLRQCVTIPNARTVNVNIANAGAKNLTVAAGGSLIINEEQSLLVNEWIANSGQLTVRDNASLIQVDNAVNPLNTGNIKVERLSSPMNKSGYTYWGAPVNILPNQVQWYKQEVLGEGAYTSATSPHADALYVWGDGNGSAAGSQEGWHKRYNEYVPGAGFIARAPSAFPSAANADRYRIKAVFEGKPNNATINRTIVPSGGGAISPYVSSKMTFLSNPYPSAIDIDKLLTEYGATAIVPTIYLWGHATNPILNEAGTLMEYQGSDFATYNLMGGTAAISGSAIPTGKVASGQGFFIMGSTSGGSVAFKNSYRYSGDAANPTSLDNKQFFRLNATHASTTTEEETFEKHRFWLNLTGENAEFKQALIGYSNLASDGVDALDGVHYDGGNQTNLYTMLEDYQFIIQAFAMPFDDTDVIPLGFKVGTAGTYTISLADFDGLFGNQDIYIKDNLTEVEHDLKQTAYQFLTEQGVFEQRFEIIFRNSLNIHTPTQLDQSWIVYAKDNQFHLESLALISRRFMCMICWAERCIQNKT